MMYQPLNVPRQLDGRIHLEDFSNPVWGQLIRRHAHRFLEVHLLVRGKAVMVIRNQRVDLPSGSLLWLPPETEHLTLEASAGLRRWHLCMRTPSARRILAPGEAAALLSRRKPTPCVQLGRAELRDLGGIFAGVGEQVDRADAVTNSGLAYALARAAVATREAERSTEPTTLHPGVARALSLMQGDGLLLDRDELAERCGLSATHLSRLFSLELGQTLRDVRNRKRLGRFHQLIDSGTCQTLTEAALEAGFGSYSQFHRVYRHFTGRSPSGREH
ncbi:MAG: AraC family transcriptional regulator [bacterium]|nr:AraC family transcriptional regulator [bacterium]